MQREVDYDTLVMIEDNNNTNFGVSSSTIEALDTINMQELNGATTFDMPLMESMIHNRRHVSPSINREEKSGEKQEIQGTSLGIQSMESNNHLKTGIVKARDKKKGENSKMNGKQHYMQIGEEHNICNGIELLWP